MLSRTIHRLTRLEDEDRFFMPPGDRARLRRLLRALDSASEASAAWLAGHGGPGRCACLFCKDAAAALWAADTARDLLAGSAPAGLAD